GRVEGRARAFRRTIPCDASYAGDPTDRDIPRRRRPIASRFVASRLRPQAGAAGGHGGRSVSLRLVKSYFAPKYAATFDRVTRIRDSVLVRLRGYVCRLGNSSISSVYVEAVTISVTPVSERGTLARRP